MQHILYHVLSHCNHDEHACICISPIHLFTLHAPVFHDRTQVKVTDFGLAKKANREGLKTFCGTPQYFAPEVCMYCIFVVNCVFVVRR